MERRKKGKYSRCDSYMSMIIDQLLKFFLKGGEMRENYGGVNLIKTYCKHICKYHNESFL
jgi:hypothetical protein